MTLGISFGCLLLSTAIGIIFALNHAIRFVLLQSETEICNQQQIKR